MPDISITADVEVTIDLEYSFKCAKCTNPLEQYDVSGRGTSRIFHVEPCEHCIEEATEGWQSLSWDCI